MKYILNNDKLEVVGKQYLEGVGNYDGTNSNSNNVNDLATVIADLSSKINIGGSGNGGGSSSGSGAYGLVEHGTSDTTFSLTPNTFHVWGEVTELTLIFEEETAGVANEYLFQFESGTEPTVLTLPNDIVWANDEMPVIESGYIYQVSILKGFATLMRFVKPINLIYFTIDGTSYQAAYGMTWEQWINSEYNIDYYYIAFDSVLNKYIVCKNSGGYGITNVNINDIIQSLNYTTSFVSGSGGGA